MPFEIRAATSVADYLFLRRVRNQVRREMTNDTAPIGYFRQLRFYLSRQPNLAVYICSTDQGLAGYLMLRDEAATCLITEAVDRRYRRRGVASNLIRFAQSIRADITAQILSSNIASIKLHQSAGFRLSGDDGRIATYRFRR